jgi:bacillopeptidase F (M6 metalloprotease family)
VQVVPGLPHGGRYAFWSQRSDESDTRLTRAFDLTGLTSATLTYWAWWDIEADFDYAYLEISTDDGQTWKILKTPSATSDDPNGNNFGWGYTGKSGGGGSPQWVEESVDLSAYAGRKVLLRFEYVTDTALVHPGFMLDDVAIPELNDHADFEADDGGWKAEGFVRMDNLLPQTFVVQAIRQGAQTTVERMPLDEHNQGSLTLNLAEGESAVLVVSGTTPFTTEVASYEFEIR